MAQQAKPAFCGIQVTRFEACLRSQQQPCLAAELRTASREVPPCTPHHCFLHPAQGNQCCWVKPSYLPSRCTAEVPQNPFQEHRHSNLFITSATSIPRAPASCTRVSPGKHQSCRRLRYRGPSRLYFLHVIEENKYQV